MTLRKLLTRVPLSCLSALESILLGSVMLFVANCVCLVASPFNIKLSSVIMYLQYVQGDQHSLLNILMHQSAYNFPSLCSSHTNSLYACYSTFHCSPRFNVPGRLAVQLCSSAPDAHAAPHPSHRPKGGDAQQLKDDHRSDTAPYWPSNKD